MRAHNRSRQATPYYRWQLMQSVYICSEHWRKYTLQTFEAVCSDIFEIFVKIYRKVLCILILSKWQHYFWHVIVSVHECVHARNKQIRYKSIRYVESVFFRLSSAMWCILQNVLPSSDFQLLVFKMEMLKLILINPLLFYHGHEFTSKRICDAEAFSKRKQCSISYENWFGLNYIVGLGN